MCRECLTGHGTSGILFITLIPSTLLGVSERPRRHERSGTMSNVTSGTERKMRMCMCGMMPHTP